MFNKSINFIRRLNRKNSFFQTRVFRVSGLLGIWKLWKNTKLKLGISKVMSPRPKKLTWTWNVNRPTNIIRILYTAATQDLLLSVRRDLKFYAG